jgi:adenylosuccinate lyase
MLPEELLSPLDGRYSKMHSAKDRFSESAQHRIRWKLELLWMASLREALPNQVSEGDQKRLQDLAALPMGNDELHRLRRHESEIGHDIKALELVLRENLDNAELGHLKHLLHFGLTSEDVVGTAWSMSLSVWWEGFSYRITKMRDALHLLARLSAGPMVARTHGQPAAPTSMAKELEVFDFRLKTVDPGCPNRLMVKWGGAVGTMAALELAVPGYNWSHHCDRFITSLAPGRIYRDSVTTQIGGRDALAERLHLLMRVNNVLTGLCQDLWQYCSLDYFRVKQNPAQVGSSTMPQKVNPISFEMAEGNFGLSNAMLSFMADKLTRSRMQRDLSDSTVMRSLGSALAYSEVAVNSLIRGLSSLEFRRETVESEANCHYELLAEVVQTIMRVNGDPDAYEKVRAATQGMRSVGAKEFWSALSKVVPPLVAVQVPPIGGCLGSAARGWADRGWAAD